MGFRALTGCRLFSQGSLGSGRKSMALMGGMNTPGFLGRKGCRLAVSMANLVRVTLAASLSGCSLATMAVDIIRNSLASLGAISPRYSGLVLEVDSISGC